MYIPQLPLIPSKVPFKFKRLQFPAKVCFAMTINKAQGQTLEVGGLHLEMSCFSHGQLYVELSGVRSKENLYISPKRKTNVVYPGIL